MTHVTTWAQWAIATALLIVVNVIAAYLPGRVDLTEEGRYTLTRATEEIVERIGEPLYVEVLLEGEFPAGFRRLRDAVEEQLRDFADVNGRLEYAFTDPIPDGTPALEANETKKALADRGINPITFRVADVASNNTSLLYPYAVLTYRGQRAVVNLLENNIPGQSPDVALNNSVSLLEYKLANAVQKLLRQKRPLIAFTTGHGELDELQTRSLTNALSPYYQVGRVRLDTMGSFGPDRVGALLVARPRGAFTEREKFIIDQYVMRGGRVVWMVDRLRINLDSLRGRRDFVPRDLDLNLDDLLFRYGFRVEPNLVLDLQSTRVPVVVGQLGNAPQMELRPWPYHVLANPNPRHPITKSLQPVNLFFPSELDTTVRTKTPVRKTALLASTDNALVRFSPVRVDLESARLELDPARFDKGPILIGALAEGTFPSLYENRLGSEFAAQLDAIGESFRAASLPTKMIVVADGDLAKNQVNPEQGAFRPLGLNPFDNYVFDNQDFLLNAIEYLFDDSGVISARNREVKLRLLDAPRAQAEATKWQFVNVALPLLALGLFGAAYGYLRRRRYSRP